MRHRHLKATLLFAWVFPAACDASPPDAAPAAVPAGDPVAGAHAAAPGQAAEPAAGMAAKVKETMEGGGYTYALLTSGDREWWVAGPLTAISVGDDVSVPPGAPMAQFHSRTLDRTFDVIEFVSWIRVGDAPVPQPGDAHATAAPEAAVSVAKLDGGVTVLDLYTRRDALAGSQVGLRGKVMRFNAGILGRNWVHIQDGTGDAAQGTHDLTVTTGSTAAVGDVVVVRGTVATDKDFGAGYSYALIVEDATVEVEP